MKTKRIKATLGRLYEIDGKFIGTHWELPADAKSYEQMRQQVGAEIERSINRWLAGTSGPDGEAKLAATVLASIGITQPKKMKGTK